MKLLCLLVLLCLPTCSFSPSIHHRILCASQKSPQEALALYLEAFPSHATHDFSLLRKIGENGLKIGMRSQDSYIRKNSIIGTSLVGSTESLELLLQAIDVEDPLQQLLILSSLSTHLGDAVEGLLFKAMQSPYPMIRLEAAYRLASMKQIQVIDYLHAFIHQLPEEVQALSAAIFLRLETEESDTYIRDLLTSKKSTIRNYTALLIAECGQKRFLPTLRNLLTSALPLDQEGAVYALGKLKDGRSTPMLQKALEKGLPNLSLAVAQTFLFLGDEEAALPIIQQQVQEGNPRAVYTARFLSKKLGEALLLPIFRQTQNSELQLNAALALLQLNSHDPALADYLFTLLEEPYHNRALVPVFSPGKATQSWKYVNISPSSTPINRSRMLASMRCAEEQILVSLLQHPHANLHIHRILTSRKPSLAAKAILFLSQQPNSQTLEFLKGATELPGEPLVRAYAHLALYYLTQNPKHKEALYEYAKEFIQSSLCFVDTEEQYTRLDSPYLRYQVAPETQAQLMLNILEILVASKTHEDIHFLIQLMVHAKIENVYLLSGLLIKIVE